MFWFRIVAALLAIHSTTRTLSAEPYAPRRLTAAQAAEDIALLRDALERVHPGFGRYVSAAEHRRQLDALEARIAVGTTDMELFGEVSRILALLRCDHTKAELPEAIASYRSTTPSYLPLHHRIFAGRMYVDSLVADDLPVARGDEILAINGRPVGAILADVHPLVSVDGWTDASAIPEMEFSTEYLGDAIDHYWPFLYGWPAKWRLEVRQARDGNVVAFDAPAVTYDQWRRSALAWVTGLGPEGVDVENFRDAVRFTVLDEQTARLTIGTFVNYRTPVDPVEVFTPIFRELREKQIKHLILDLRVCGGGSDDVPVALAGFLLERRPPNRTETWVRTYELGALRAHMRTWDATALDPPAEMFEKLDNGYYRVKNDDSAAGEEFAPQPDRFSGRLSILTSAGNASGATMLIATLRACRPKTQTIGAPTGGSVDGPTAGIIFFLTLPNSGITVRVPAMRVVTGLPNPRPSMGVVPDVRVVTTAEDYFAGRDAALDAAQSAGSSDE